MKVLVFDTEATDIEPGQICQLSYIVDDGGALAADNLFFAVDSMSEGSQEVHGMSIGQLAELSGGRTFADRAQELFEVFSRADLLVGHNVAFDDRYIRVEFERAGLKLPKIRTFCTMNFFTPLMSLKRKVQTGRPKPPKLGELVEYYGVTQEEIQQKCDELFAGGEAAHDARFDTVATWLCMRRASEKGDLRGIF